MSREIVSLQFGHYSNHVGTHLWNSIENSFVYNGDHISEVNHDILYRVGSTSKGLETYTPRLLLVDLNNSLCHISAFGELYEDELEDIPNPNWEENVDVINEPKAEPNQYIKDIENAATGIDTKAERLYELDGLVNTWTDYLYTRFHPRTINIVKEYSHRNKEVKFDTLTSGKELWNTDQFQEDYCDRLRRYIEECDHLQGFHVTLDSTDGFSGLASSCIEHIHDEYNAGAVAFPVIASGLSANVMDVSIQIANIVLCYKDLIEHSSLFVPLSLDHASSWRLNDNTRKFSHININSNSIYHTSSIIATALETFTLPYRVRSNECYTINSFCTDLSGGGRKMAAASLGLPFGNGHNIDLIDHLDSLEHPMYTSLTPNCAIGTDKMLQLFTLRGISEDHLKRPLKNAGKQIQMEAYKYNSVKDMMEFYFACNGYATATNVTVTTTPFKIPSSFPQFFNEYVDRNGCIAVVPREENENVVTTPVIAGLHSTPKLSDSIASLIREAERIKINKIHRFKETGLESDDYTETLNVLKEFQECYEDNMYL